MRISTGILQRPINHPLGQGTTSAAGPADQESRAQPRGSSELANPPIGDVMADTGARYRAVSGEVFIEGPGDGRAIHPNDVRQGALGDCYFMASLAAIARSDPQTLQKNIRDNADGSYTVTLYERQPPGTRGRGFDRREIRVSADLPVEGGRLAFAQGGDTHARETELWVALYEKAFAKLAGSYANIEGGRGHEAMEAITGKESASHSPTRKSLETIDRALRKGDAVTAGTLPRMFALDDRLFNDGTLVASHEYYVVGVDRNKGTVTVRNPFGWQFGPTTLAIEDFIRCFGRVSINSGG